MVRLELATPGLQTQCSRICSVLLLRAVCAFASSHIDLRAIVKSRCNECIIHNFSTRYWLKVSDFAKYTFIFYKFLIEFLCMGFKC